MNDSTKDKHVELSRGAVTTILTAAAIDYFIEKRYGVYQEIGVNKWGKLRADVFAINMKGHVIICEVKSGADDFRTDKKMFNYLDYCNQMYLVVGTKSKKWLKKHLPALKEKGIGILAVDTKTTSVRVVQKAKITDIDPTVKLDMLTRTAWKAAPHSLRTRRR